MTTTNFARLQDRARIAAPGALDGVIRMETYDALKEFFGRTDAWLFELPVYISPTTNDYQVETCQQAIVQRLTCRWWAMSPNISGPLNACAASRAAKGQFERINRS